MELFSKYHYPFSILGLADKVHEVTESASKNYNPEVLKRIFSLIDLTSLNSTDSADKIKNMCAKVNDFNNHYSSFPSVAGICVYPSLVATVKKALLKKEVKIVSVAANFPSSQTFIEVKISEVKMAVENGADEIDIVISLGEFLSGNFKKVHEEISAIKNSINKAHLKVIIESGALVDPLKIWEASIIAMDAGADFIKTSTGKMQPAATVESVVVMAAAIKAFEQATKKKTGIKPAGGISTGKDAVLYYTIVENILGESWLNPGLFRIGASSLANALINEIKTMESKTEKIENYF